MQIMILLRQYGLMQYNLKNYQVIKHTGMETEILQLVFSKSPLVG